MSAKKRNHGKRKTQKRNLLQAFPIDKKTRIINVISGVKNFLAKEFLKEKHTERLVIVFFAQNNCRRGCRRFLRDLYIDDNSDIELMERCLRNPHIMGLRKNEVVVVSLFYERFFEIHLKA